MQNAEMLNVKPGGTNSDHWAVTCQLIIPAIYQEQELRKRPC